MLVDPEGTNLVYHGRRNGTCATLGTPWTYGNHSRLAPSEKFFSCYGTCTASYKNRVGSNNYNVALLISQQHKARLLDGSPYTSSPSPTIMSFIYVFLGPSDIDGPRNRHFEEEIKSNTMKRIHVHKFHLHIYHHLNLTNNAHEQSVPRPR